MNTYSFPISLIIKRTILISGKTYKKAVEMYLVKILLDQFHFLGLLQNKVPIFNFSTNNTSS